MTEKFSLLGTSLFALAVLHTFSIRQFQRLASRFPEGSVAENFFHLLGEVEVIFGLWAGALILTLITLTTSHETVVFLENLNFTEPLFVFVIMAMASTKPIIELATTFIQKVAGSKSENAFFFFALTLGPLLGSFITEPAAMTVTALILKKRFFDNAPSEKFKYLTLAVLFVNISVGGVLTHFAAPPVLMVANLWQWDSAFMFDNFGWKAIIAVTLNSFLAQFILRKEIKAMKSQEGIALSVPVWVASIHILFLALTVFTSHHPVLFIGLFLFFLGFTSITKEYQDELKLKESLLVAFFLGGLVVLGSFQSWWLKPILESLQASALFVSATLLTAFVDNAALTYLGAQVPQITEEIKYALVAGAVAGGGLTVIANAPNPAGFSILGSSFGKGGISPLKLFLFAAPPTAIVMIALWLL